MKGPAIAEVSLILALEAVDYYTGKNTDQIQGETHDVKH
jgi:hypothetical protein